MTGRHEARKWAMQVLFQLHVNPEDSAEGTQHYFTKEDADPASREFAKELLHGTREHLEEIDGLIQKCADHWDIDRMGRVDKCIMQIAVYEMLHCKDIPPAVSINEAIDIAKEFGSEHSGKFVNGVLDRARKQLGLPADRGKGSDNETEG